jgi:hypothetical protein
MVSNHVLETNCHTDTSRRLGKAIKRKIMTML